MAIAVLLLWLVTAGAGLRVLITSGLARRPASAPAQTQPAQTQPARTQPAQTQPAQGKPAQPQSKPARMQPVLLRPRDEPRNEPRPGLRDLVEFVHPALGVTGLAFWLGYTFVHNRLLAWIAFGIAVLTVTAGLSWFTVNLRAARKRPAGAPGPVFSPRLLALHGGAAAITFALAALTAVTAHRLPAPVSGHRNGEPAGNFR